jgi:hypothetical protein
MSSRSTPTNTNSAGGVERVFAGVVSFVKSCIRLGDYLLGVWCYLFSQAHIVLLGVILASIRLLHAYYTLRVVEKFETLITVGFICQSLHNTRGRFHGLPYHTAGTGWQINSKLLPTRHRLSCGEPEQRAKSSTLQMSSTKFLSMALIYFVLQTF